MITPGLNMGFAVISGLKSGTIAGAEAATIAPGDVDEGEVKRLKEEIYAPLQRKEGIKPDDFVYELQKVVGPVKYFFYKSKDRLEEALAVVEQLKGEVPKLKAQDNHELAKCHEAKSMMICAEMAHRASLMRTETRGVHMREDYPERNDKDWLKWIIIKRDNGRMALCTEDIPMERYKFKP
jgi:succinate dehydrogenase/fumarate reductase flavoprotein subunit